MAKEILLLLPPIKTSSEYLCEELKYLIEVGRSMGIHNLESLPLDLQNTIKNRANTIEFELGKINMCLDQLNVSRKILETCVDNFDEYVLNASSNIPSLEQLSARVIKENPEMFPVIPHYVPRSFLKENVDKYRTSRLKAMKSRKKKKSKSA